MKPQGQTLTGSGLYLSFLSKSDPLCGRHLVEQCDLTKQVYRERRLHAKQRPPPASIKFSAKQLWSSCSSSTCESSLTGNRQGQRMNTRTQHTIRSSLHTPMIFRTRYLVSERSWQEPGTCQHYITVWLTFGTSMIRKTVCVNSSY